MSRGYIKSREDERCNDTKKKEVLCGMHLNKNLSSNRVFRMPIQRRKDIDSCKSRVSRAFPSTTYGVPLRIERIAGTTRDSLPNALFADAHLFCAACCRTTLRAYFTSIIACAAHSRRVIVGRALIETLESPLAPK